MGYGWVMVAKYGGWNQKSQGQPPFGCKPKTLVKNGDKLPFPQLVNAGILSMIDMMHFLYNMWQHVPLKTTSHEISSLRLTDVSQAHPPILDDFWTLGIPSRWRHIHTKHVVFCLAVQTILQTCFWWKAISWDFIHGQSGKSVAYLTVIRQQTDPLPPNIWIDEITTFHRHCMQTRFCSHHRYGHEHASHRGRIRFFSTEILQNTRELGRHPTTLIFGPTEANIANIWHVLNTGDRMKTNPSPCCTLCCFTNQFLTWGSSYNGCIDEDHADRNER